MIEQVTYSIRRPSQSGFGIVEIMIALALGVIIMLGVTQIATNNSNTRYELDRSGRQMENATYALREVESDLANSGYWGELGAQPVTTFPPVCPVDACDIETYEDLSDATCQLNWALAFPLQGGTGEFDCATADTSDANKITPKAGTDYLVIRRAKSCALEPGACEDAEANFYLQVNACFNPSDDTAPLPGVTYLIDTDTDNLDYEQRDCDDTNLAPIYRFLNRIYYINDDDQLVRAELVENEYEQTVLVDGVELMRLEYGLDTSGDGQVDAYTDDPNDPDPNAWADVVMVRVSLVVRSDSQSSGFSDTKTYTLVGDTYCADGSCDIDIPADFRNHRRQLYQRTVSLRNVAGRRE